MANKFTDTDIYSSIAKAIRRVKGVSTKYYPREMAAAINPLDKRVTLPSLGGFANSTWSTFDVSNFIIPNGQLNYTFGNCKNLITIDLGSWDYLNSVTLFRTFSGDTSLLSVQNLHHNTISLSGGTFRNCTSLTNLDFMSDWNVTSTNSFNSIGIFEGCTSLNDISGINNSHFTFGADMGPFFRNCSSLVNADLSNCICNGVKNLSRFFNGCTSLQTVNFPSMAVSNLSETFAGGYNTGEEMTIINLDLSNIDTSNCHSLNNTFLMCKNLTNLNITG